MLTADHMRSLPGCLVDIPDPRRSQGRRHPLPTALAMVAGSGAVRGARLPGDRRLGCAFDYFLVTDNTKPRVSRSAVEVRQNGLPWRPW